jgi:hypothetical protein
MKALALNDTNYVEFSLGNFKNIANFKTLFENIKRTWEKEQKAILLHKKSRQEEMEYFSFMKFLFSSPDKI